MSMKKTDLDKIKGKQIAGGGFAGAGDRFGRGAAAQPRPGTSASSASATARWASCPSR
jgi:hypothetical protein